MLWLQGQESIVYRGNMSRGSACRDILLQFLESALSCAVGLFTER